jgi:hypothetical protein
VYLLHASMMPFMVSASLTHLLGWMRNALIMMLAIVLFTRVLRAIGVRYSSGRGAMSARGAAAWMPTAR